MNAADAPRVYLHPDGTEVIYISHGGHRLCFAGSVDSEKADAGITTPQAEADNDAPLITLGYVRHDDGEAHVHVLRDGMCLAIVEFNGDAGLRVFAFHTGHLGARSVHI